MRSIRGERYTREVKYYVPSTMKKFHEPTKGGIIPTKIRYANELCSQ